MMFLTDDYIEWLDSLPDYPPVVKDAVLWMHRDTGISSAECAEMMKEDPGWLETYRIDQDPQSGVYG